MNRPLRAPTCVLLGFCLSACAPYGRINTSMGTDRLRAAWHAEVPYQGFNTLVILLTNSDLDCEIPSSADPAERLQAQEEIYLAMSREDARVVGLQLFSSDTSTWKGQYIVEEAVDPRALDSIEPRMAQALYIGVNEAGSEQIDGLYRTYYDIDAVEIYGVEGPGLVNIDTEGENVEGDFSLDAVNVSGTFHTTWCDAKDSILARLGYSSQATGD